ncbi:MAG: DNA modification methylase, partial [Alphaproteobacteria bacterium HGW-Alphaproteobacteria-8]
EPFCGSGTQIVAAERAGRRCFAMELDPVYCDVAVRRWEMATGRKAMIPAH